MRNKISTSVFWITLIETFILTQASSGFSDLMTLLSFGKNIKIDNVELNIALLYLPIIISIIENIFKMHDVIGKRVNLRNRYDGLIIFYQYLTEFGIQKTRNDCKKIYINDKELRDTIGKHFYSYTSSTKPIIDKHDIIMALDAWCWVWILIDNIVISLLFLIGSLLYTIIFHGSYWLVLGLLIFIILLIILTFFTLKFECAKYSTREVKNIIIYDNEQNEGKKNEELKEKIENALQCK